MFLLGFLINSGCTTNESPQGYSILFQSPPDIYSNHIYDNGIEVGRIIDKKMNSMGIMKLSIELNSDWVATNHENVAFYPNNGNLEVDRLLDFGSPISKENVFCGFPGKSGIVWFKLKTLISDRSAAAKQRAVELQAMFSIQ